MVNGIEWVNHSIVKKSGDICSCAIFRDPIELNQCDVTNFISRTTNSKITNAYISILIELDLCRVKIFLKINSKLSNFFYLLKKGMPKFEFHCIEYEKYSTATIVIGHASLKLKDCKILRKEKTKYSYQKAVVKLSPEKAIEMKKIEEKVNKYLEEEGLSSIKLIYGNGVYPKVKQEGQDYPGLLT